MIHDLIELSSELRCLIEHRPQSSFELGFELIQILPKLPLEQPTLAQMALLISDIGLCENIGISSFVKGSKIEDYSSDRENV